MSRPTPLDNRIPPPVAMLLVGAAMWAAAGARQALAFDPPLRIPLVALIALIGLWIEAAAAVSFFRARTTVNPLRPQNASRLVTEGLNRFSRNPMYVGQSALLLAWAVWLAHPAALALWPLFPLFITRFQIQPEERALAVRFGAEYASYRARVRRWL
jgi:protein-S-isoprenylcysteine O-methyltransferase Ste14